MHHAMSQVMQSLRFRRSLAAGLHALHMERHCYATIAPDVNAITMLEQSAGEVTHRYLQMTVAQRSMAGKQISPSALPVTK